MRTILFFAFAIFLAGCAGSSENKPSRSLQQELKNFPGAQSGQQRFVIYLPERTEAETQNLNVELLAGKSLDVDCNKHGLQGELQTQSLQGFGYDYYVLRTDGNVYSTKMGCPDNTLRREFITVPSTRVNYNHKLPIVVYAPAGYEVRYRVWNGGVLQAAAVQ